MADEIFNHLNDNQIKAVKATEGYVRVVAGAGSGKTRVLTNRYAYLVDRLGIDSANILCMTFTNKAAQEMRNRIRKMVSTASTNDYICTLHGLCVKILRREITRLGYPKNFIIADNDDCISMMKQVMEELQLSRKDVTANQLLDEVCLYKTRREYIPFLLPDGVWPEEAGKSSILRYIQLQQKNYALDFNDLILFTLYIFYNFSDALDYWQREFDYIQIDEVQDCSLTDWELIKHLSARCKNLFIVGDPDQTIYEWRGAKPELFLGFNATTDIILDENYRSTPNILDVANSVISHNTKRIKKKLRSNIPANTIVLHKHAKNESEEGHWIATQIENLIHQGAKPEQFAILYRSSTQSRFIEQAIISKQLPYTVWGGIRFFERREIKDCIAYLRMMQHKDDISFMRIINTPSRKFGKVKLETLQQLAEAENCTLYQAIKNNINNKPFCYKEIHDFVEHIEQLSKHVDTIHISDLLDKILSTTGLGSIYRKDEDKTRLENIEELINSIRFYEEGNKEEEITLEHYLQDIALFTNNDYNKSGTTIKLMTIHQAKGLEFPYVFVVGLTEGIFPSHRTIRERKLDGLEEERRLMYVAVTRAEKALFLTESEGYNYNIKSEKYPSRFLSEIDESLIKVEGNIDPDLLKGRDQCIADIDEEIDAANRAVEPTFAIGDIVEHPIFGKGKVISVNESRMSCEVDFGEKQRNILWKFLTKANSEE